jgi:hypothetical protein
VMKGCFSGTSGSPAAFFEKHLSCVEQRKRHFGPRRNDKQEPSVEF